MVLIEELFLMVTLSGNIKVATSRILTLQR